MVPSGSCTVSFRVSNVTEILAPGLYEGGIGSDHQVAPADGGSDLSRSAYPPGLLLSSGSHGARSHDCHNPPFDGSPGRIPFLLATGLGHGATDHDSHHVGMRLALVALPLPFASLRTISLPVIQGPTKITSFLVS